jgi:hypothetical protein
MLANLDEEEMDSFCAEETLRINKEPSKIIQMESKIVIEDLILEEYLLLLLNNCIRAVSDES